jgi:hypothetical protein
MTTKHTCCAKISDNDRWRPYYHSCGKNAKYEREGKFYCGTHDPVAVAAKRDARSADYRSKCAEQTKIYRLQNAAPDLLAALQMAKHIVANEGTKEQADQVFDAIEKATGEPA